MRSKEPQRSVVVLVEVGAGWFEVKMKMSDERKAEANQPVLMKINKKLKQYVETQV